MSIAAAAAPLGSSMDTHGAEAVEQLRGATVFGFGLAGSAMAITWVQSLSPPPLPRVTVVARWCVVGMALVVGVLATGLPPLAQVGLLAVAMVALVMLSVRFADSSETGVEAM